MALPKVPVPSRGSAGWWGVGGSISGKTGGSGVAPTSSHGALDN